MLDNDGYLTLTGRLKEMINRSGEKISPLEIDNALLDHPAVAEAVAFGVAHQTHGEEPSAAVVLTGEVTPQELVAFCRTKLADYKCPRVIHVMQEIPRGPTGKIQRRFLTEMSPSSPDPLPGKAGTRVPGRLVPSPLKGEGQDGGYQRTGRPKHAARQGRQQ